MITLLTTHHFMNIYLDLLLFLIWHTFLLQFLTIKMNRKNRSGKKLYENMKNVLPRKNISNMSSSTHNIWNWYCRPPAQSVVASFLSLTYHRALETLLISKRLYLYTKKDLLNVYSFALRGVSFIHIRIVSIKFYNEYSWKSAS